MGRGARARHEFVDDGMHVKRRRKSDRRPEIQLPNPKHTDLRVVRYASLDQRYSSVAWDRYLNSLARENRALGSAVPIGSIAITQFSSQAMNAQLREVFPNDYFHHKRKPRLFKKAKSEIDGYLREMESSHQWKRSEEMVAAHDTRMGHEVSALSGAAIPADMDVDDDFDMSVESELHPFGQARFETSQLQPHGHKYAIDLTLDRDDILQEEFSGLHRFIGSSILGKNISQRGNIPFHATVFRLHDYVGVPALSSGQDAMPTQMFFEKPQTEIHTVGVK